MLAEPAETKAPEQPSELTYLSATKLAEMIRTKKVSSEEVIRAHIARIKAVNPKINAVVQLAEEQALTQARQSDLAVAKGEVDFHQRPLHGVPVTIKDCFETEGIITAFGTLGLRHFIPKKDATAVARFKKAGAIVLGKTNVPELCFWLETDNLLYGRTSNPYDERRTPGGSSGGEAAIIAAGGSPLGLGADGGGSIRVPSHFCGIAGLKPTWGRVPLTGCLSASQFAQDDFFAVAGPMARRVDDLALGLRVLAGADGFDAHSFPVPLRDFEKVELRRLRIAFYVDDPLAPSTVEVQGTVRKAASVLSSLAGVVEELKPPGIGQPSTFEHGKLLYLLDQQESYRYRLRELGTTKVSPLLDASLAMPSTTPSAEQRLRAFAWWKWFKNSMREFFSERVDALVCPAYVRTAPLHGAISLANPENVPTAYYSVAQVPAVVVRCGTSQEGLPIGVQVVAGHWREDIAIAVAKCLEDRLGGWQPPKQ